jgi:hypothetical protein
MIEHAGFKHSLLSQEVQPSGFIYFRHEGKWRKPTKIKFDPKFTLASYKC